MVLVDTSVWVTHFRKGVPHLIKLLNEGNVACHPFVVGELVCGNLRNRGEILGLLKALPLCIWVDHDEVLQFIENHQLMGIGLGYIDASLLASSLLSNIVIWTFDKRLKQVAVSLSLDYKSR
jgi:predicted nucleic acid-binding protein